MSRLRPLFNSLLFLCLSIILISCSKDSVIEPEAPVAGDLPVRKISNLGADTATQNKFTYFRLSDSTIVTGADTATANWDIAFKGTTIIINGGPVRFGNGAAIVYTGTFDATTTAPESGYAVDSTATKLAIPTGSGNGWYSYDFATNYIAPITTRILIIKTGSGKFAKIEIISYYKNADPQPMPNPINFRYFTFRYVYQPDGSRQLK